MIRLVTFSILALLALVSNYCFAQADLVGQLGEKLGTTLTVQGILVEGLDKGYETGPNLLVQVIDDSVIQEFIQIPLSTYFGKFGDEPLPKLKNNATYLFRVFETGAFVGIPADARKEARSILQAPGFYFRNELIVISGKEIEPIEYSPANFVGRSALLSGIAKIENSVSVIESSNWKLRLIGFRKWTESEIGKTAEVYGKIKTSTTMNEYDVENGRARLVRLQDQVGKMVKLRGRAINLNQYWWFNYRGIDLYVEKMTALPADDHFRAMEVTGILEEEKLPRIDQIVEKENRDRKLYYIVRKASWSVTDELLAPELE